MTPTKQKNDRPDHITETVAVGGVAVYAWIAEDGAPVVQIDTDPDTDDHDRVRVYLNDSRAHSWRNDETGAIAPAADLPLAEKEPA